MKKNQLYVLWVITGCLLFSCHKPDFPGATKGCQLIKVQGHSLSGSGGTVYEYSYNSKRLMDTLKFGSEGFPPLVVMPVEYNAQSQPVSILGYKLIYQNGRVIRIDQLGMNNLYQTLYTYTYDVYGRVLKRTSSIDTLLWEYQGSSRNFVRRFSLDARQPDGWGLMEEYQYDHTVNPRANWLNLPLNPIAFDIYEGYGTSFDPIPDNNCTYRAYTGRVSGIPFRYQEVFHSYEYDNVYPVLDHIRQVQHQQGIPDRESLYEISYTYACRNNNNGHLQ